MGDTPRAIWDMLTKAAHEIPPEVWPRLVWSSPIIRKMVLSTEGMAAFSQFSSQAKTLRAKLASVMVEEGLIGAGEANDLGIVPLLQRVLVHLQDVGRKKDQQPQD